MDTTEPHQSGDDWYRYALALEASDDGFWDWDLATGQLWASARFRSIAGLGASCSTIDDWLARVHPHDRPRLEAELRALREGGSGSFSAEHRVQSHDGSWRWVNLRGIVSREASGRITHIAGSLRDNTRCRLTDPLTSLPNRTFFVEHLERRIERGFHHGDWNFAVLALVLDRFEQLYETLGSGGGERLLIETAARLQSLLPAPSVAARLMGAQFMILLEDVHAEAAASRFAVQLLASLRQPFLWRGHTLSTQLAIGVAQAGLQYSHPEELMADAESALTQARRQTSDSVRPGVASCSPSTAEAMRTRAMASLELEADLRGAIDRGDLVLHYQPEVDLRTNAIIGFEALVRWRHARRGLIPPGEFIPLAEQTGLIVPLGEWGIAEACRQLVAWHQAASEPLRRARMSVNLSARQMEQPALVDQVRRVLEQTGLEPASLRLEVTESSLISDAPAALQTMRALEELGVGLHMDDFGTGYSSLDYLQRFPFDTLKIDRSFVQGVAHDRDSRLIVGSILELARSFGMNVVAEGIEDQEQLEELKNLGCPCGQGFYFARPLEPSAIADMVRTGAWPGQAAAASLAQA